MHHLLVIAYLYINKYRLCQNDEIDDSLLPSFFFHTIGSVVFRFITYEPPRGKTNNVVSEQVRHKPACTSTEKS